VDRTSHEEHRDSIRGVAFVVSHLQVPALIRMLLEDPSMMCNTAVTLSEYSFYLALGIDQVLRVDHVGVRIPFLHRMAMTTSIAFTLLCASPTGGGG